MQVCTRQPVWRDSQEVVVRLAVGGEKAASLEEQLSEAEELKKFRDKRGKAILALLESLLSAEETEKYVAMLGRMVRVVQERREVEEKIVRGEQQIQALAQAPS